MHKTDLVLQIYPTRHYEQLTDKIIMQRVRGDTVRRNITSSGRRRNNRPRGLATTPTVYAC
jgi:hypothetical protein